MPFDYFTRYPHTSILPAYMLTDKTLNKLSPKDTVAEVFDKMGGVKAMTDWAKKNPTTFYTQMYGKLVSPTFQVGDGIKIVIELPWITSRPGPRIIEGEATLLPQATGKKGRG